MFLRFNKTNDVKVNHVYGFWEMIEINKKFHVILSTNVMLKKHKKVLENLLNPEILVKSSS